MKLMSQISKSTLSATCGNHIVEFIAEIGTYRKLDQPTMSGEIRCNFCGGHEHYAVFMNSDPPDLRKLWICANTVCLTVQQSTVKVTTKVLPPPQRSIVWPKFCEINGIGDEHYSVRFESINQSVGKIDYMLKFGNNPRGLLIMQGETGTGKTYAAMGICELFTRKSMSCIFITCKQMRDKWLQTFTDDNTNNFISGLMNCNLLVIDDFGTCEVTAKFMEFFFDLMNTRLQWSNRGTVITTNLDDQLLGKYCGEPLSDRLGTGQYFQFTDGTRRKKQTIK